MIEAQITLASEVELNLPRARKRVDACLEAYKPAYIEQRLTQLPEAVSFEIDSVGRLISHYAILLQRWIGLPVTGFATSLRHSDTLKEIIAYEHRLAQFGQVAGEISVLLCQYALSEDAASMPEKLSLRLKEFISTFVESTLIPSYVRAAEERGTPWRLLYDGVGFMNFGHGKHQHRSWQNFTDQTGHIPTVLSTRKHLAAALFRAHGLPAPQQHVVGDAHTAVRAAHQLGFPVVVKPASKDFGTAVNADLRDDKAVRGAFAIAAPHGPVLVEEFIPGDQHRITVIHGRVASVRRHKAAHVVGDGRSTIRALIEEKNRAPFYKPIALDQTTVFVLSKSGKTLESVPGEGEEVVLRTQANLQAGGTMEEVTDIAHKDNLTLAVRAAAVMGIDVAGVDFITPDITRSHLEVGGGICEINVTPAFILYEEALLINEWYPPENDGRIPIILFLDTGGSTLAHDVAAELRKGYGVVTHAAHDGVFLNDEKIVSGDHANLRGAFMALYEPTACAAVTEYTSEVFLARGLPFDRCDIVVVPRECSEEQQKIVELLRPIAGRVIDYGTTPVAIAAMLKA